MFNFKKRTGQEMGNVLEFPVDQVLKKDRPADSEPRREPEPARTHGENMDRLIKRHFIRKLHVVEYSAKDNNQ